jgi:hypothetical protein
MIAAVRAKSKNKEEQKEIAQLALRDKHTLQKTG